jgi:peptidyl-prolyl cis-trans isomerase A (cyclophilin A)
MLTLAAVAMVWSSATAAWAAQGAQEGRGSRPVINLTRAKLRTPAQLNEQAPDKFRARFDTTKGVFVIEVTREWAPLGADRFYNLVKNGFYDECRFFRVLDGFMAQFGINGDPQLMAAWRGATLRDDPVKESNRRGSVTFATGGPNTRTTQVFINYGDNSRLDRQGFAPFGRVVSGMDVVDKLYSGYGEGAPQGKGPSQAQIQTEGNAYLQKGYPRLDSVKAATIEN